MHNVEKEYNVHNIKQDATDAFLHLWEELEKVFFPERMLDEDDNSDIIDIAEGRESYGGTTDDWLQYYNRSDYFLWYSNGMVSE